MAEHHRKIELQSPDDLQYLISNVRRAANEKIDKDLPPIEGEDKMRTRVEELVHDYISAVFHTTSSNITINGLSPSPDLLNAMLANDFTDGSTSIEEHEPFNPRLWEKAKELARQEEDLIEEIAALRRKMPGVAAEQVKAVYKGGIEEDGRALESWVDEARKRDAGMGVGVGPLERQDSVEGSWKKGVEGLERLRGSLPECVAKGERAQRAEAYVIAPERK